MSTKEHPALREVKRNNLVAELMRADEQGDDEAFFAARAELDAMDEEERQQEED